MQLAEKNHLASMDTFYTGRGIDQYLSKYYTSTQDFKSNFNSYYSRSSKSNYNSQLDLSKYRNKSKHSSSKNLEIKLDLNYIKYRHNEEKETKTLKDEEGIEYKCACQSKSYKTLLKAYRKNKQKYQYKQQNKKIKVSTACQANAPQQVKVIEKIIVKEVPIKVPIQPIIHHNIPLYRPNYYCNSVSKFCCINQPKLSPGKICFNYSNNTTPKNNNKQVMTRNPIQCLTDKQQQKHVSILPQTHQYISNKQSRLSQNRKKILKQRNSNKKGIEVVQKKKVTIQSRIQNSENLQPFSTRKSLYRSSSKSIASHSSFQNEQI